MLRTAVTRGSLCLEPGLRIGVRRQWQPQRIGQPLRRAFADNKSVDQKSIPNLNTESVAGVPTQGIRHTSSPYAPPAEISGTATPKLPPTPAEAGAKSPTPSTNTGNLPPVGTGTASTGPTSAPPPPPKRPRRRLRTFLLSLFILSTLGYAGGVYYSLVSDNFHDFFTEYIPFGEDAVAYFEDREFRKRFPTRNATSATWPQRRGEEKVTIGRSSGMSPRVSAQVEKGSDLSQKGRHVSAVEDNKPQPKKDDKRVSTQHKDPEAKTPEQMPKQAADKNDQSKAKAGTPTNARTTTPEPKPAPAAKPAPPPAPPVAQIDHLNVPEASEPAVQELVKVVNNIITAVNSASDAGKYTSTLNNAKDELSKVINAITTIKSRAASDAETEIKNAHTEFDQAARELVRRLEGEMKDQGVIWRDEYEDEREKLSTSYQQRLAAELDAAKKVAEEQESNALLEQEIALQKSFMSRVQEQVETERSGRLAKLEELSGSVAELEKLTGEWNSVVDATLQTQHLQVALEAVRAKVLESEVPTPFLNELVALKSVSKENETVAAAIASINPVAYQRGIPSVAHLIDRFRRVASEVRKASLLPEDAGVASHAASAVLSRLMFTKKAERGLPLGDDVEATLARTEVLLEEGDLDGAAREMNGLKGWAGVLSRDWVGECARVLEVRQAVEVMATEARLQSLLVD